MSVCCRGVRRSDLEKVKVRTMSEGSRSERGGGEFPLQRLRVQAGFGGEVEF